jgi:tRNA(Ile)-lysidine synthase
LLKDAPVERADDTIRLSRDWLRDQPLALRRRLLRRVAADLAGRDAGLEARHISQLDGLLDTGGAGKSLNLPGGLRANLEYNALTFSRAPVSAKQPAPSRVYHLSAPGCIDAVESGWRVRAWLVEAAPGLEAKTLPELPALGHVGVQADVGRAEARVYLDADVAGKELVVRAWRPGDRFRPLGMAHEKKLQDYFADAKVPRAQRSCIPLVFNQRHLLWVGGERIDDRARLTAATRRVLALQIEPLEASSSESSSSSVESSPRPGRKGTRRP